MLGNRWPRRAEPAATPRDGVGAWRRAEFPSQVRDEQRTVLVEDAWLTRFRRGNLRSFETPNRWIMGAVHDVEGRLVVESQMIGSYGGRNLLAADPAVVPRRGQRDRLRGTWLYGGSFTDHFGHFISECLTNLWPDDLEVDGLVYHRYLTPDPQVADVHRELLGYAGYGDLPVHIVAGRAAEVERLWVPTRPVTVNGWAHPQAVEVWRRVVAGAGGPAQDVDRLWFSRADFNDRQRAHGQQVRSSAERDRELDAVFGAAGFRVVAPETLPVREQIRMVAGANVVAGQAGSALHLAVFAEAGTRCIEVGDSRTRSRPLLNQQVLNAVRDHDVTFIPESMPGVEIEQVLRRLGVSEQP
jgi:hypothetical protein